MQVSRRLYTEEAADQSTLAAEEQLPFGWGALTIIGLSLIGWAVILAPFVLL